jgi:hypothetical protein
VNEQSHNRKIENPAHQREQEQPNSHFVRKNFFKKIQTPKFLSQVKQAAPRILTP